MKKDPSILPSIGILIFIIINMIELFTNSIPDYIYFSTEIIAIGIIITGIIIDRKKKK